MIVWAPYERSLESLDNLTPEDVYTSRRQTVPDRRRRINRKNDQRAASTILPAESRLTMNLMSRKSLLNQAA
mgnify:CR=1 FL=1|jgi:hypothetical protein